MNADEAYRKATERTQKDIKQAERAIQTATAQGKLECTVTYTRETPHVLNHLTNLGYSVQPYRQNKSYRTEYAVSIGWEHSASKSNVVDAQRLEKKRLAQTPAPVRQSPHGQEDAQKDHPPQA